MHEIIEHVIRASRAAGADQCEVLLREGAEFSTQVRLGKIEKLLQAEFRKLGIRLFAGARSAMSATSDFTPERLERLVRGTLDMARAAGEDPYARLPERRLYLRRRPQLDLAFPNSLRSSAEEKIDAARRCEQAALDYDARITNSDGAVYSDSQVRTSYGNSDGVYDTYAKTLSTLYCKPLAEQNGRKQRDYWLSSQLDPARLESPEAVGRQAAQRTLRRLGARKAATGEAPVVFDPLAAATVLKHIADAVCGTALMRKASFLLGRLGARVAAGGFTVLDDAVRPAGLGSRPFDSEGVPSGTTSVIRDGVLESYLLDCYSARKLELESTASAIRKPEEASAAGPANFYIAPGEASPGDIIASVRNGLYVTSLLGFGVNIVSGDYSQGAAGMWIENGELAYPVEEITVAGNLRDMLMNVQAVGNDLTELGEVFAPTLLISKMMVSGRSSSDRAAIE
jgi:PmbA protein